MGGALELTSYGIDKCKDMTLERSILNIKCDEVKKKKTIRDIKQKHEKVTACCIILYAM